MLSPDEGSRKWILNSPADIAKWPADQQGRIRWQPYCPPGETEESLKGKQREMKDLYYAVGPAGPERGYLTQLMKTTFCLPRKIINVSPPPSTVELKNECPYLLKEMYSPFKSLRHRLDKMKRKKRKADPSLFSSRSRQGIMQMRESASWWKEKCDSYPWVLLLLMALQRKTRGTCFQAYVSVKLFS